MKALITGIKGMAGSHLLDLLVGRGVEVFGCDLPNAPNAIECHKSQFTYSDTDIRDYVELKNFFDFVKPDVVFHLAAEPFVPDSWKDPDGVVNTNILGTIHVLECARQMENKPTVQLAGSSEEYGMVHPEEIPIHPKVQPFRPLSTYGVTKVALELLGYQYFYSYGLKTITTRTFNHTGPRQNRQYITADFCAQALEYQLGKRTAIVHGNLDSVRDYTDVRDIVRGYVMAVNLVSSTGIGGMTVQLGGGVVISGHELLARITRILGITNLKTKMAQDRMRPSDVMLLAGDSSIFTMLTGWRPQFTHDQTLRDTLSYWNLRI